MIVASTAFVRILTFGNAWVKAITLYPFIFVKKEFIQNKILINHEKIHLKQQSELLVIFFYIIYGLNYLRNRMFGMDHIAAYKNIIFEKEAYANEVDMEYLRSRKCFSFLKWI